MRVKTRRQKTTYVESSRIVVSCESLCVRVCGVWRCCWLLLKRERNSEQRRFFPGTLSVRARGAALTLTALPRVPRRIYGFKVWPLNYLYGKPQPN